ncbi:abscisate beta-glucosyltransferase-like [Camellia sinensis]|uniref:abscisate beta-glucosyltransferase-like n=1 Tax=Camellia sinensis TaxID=4442 RepID=UPI0010364AA5|nr:abscisate beta-glucosyltransferase-like [Camellia sinensis]
MAKYKNSSFSGTGFDRIRAIVRFFFKPWLHVIGLFPLCCDDSLKRHAPHEKVNSDTETFVLPGLPDDNIKFSKRQLPFWYSAKADLEHLQDNMQEAESKTYGVLVNSFYDLEPAYAKYFKNEVGKKLWLAGPVCLFNKGNEQKTERGEKNSIDGGTVLNWLNSKEPKSVLYVSFGSQVRMAPEQFLEIAHGLEISGCPFIWVGRDMLEYGDDEKNNEGREGRGVKKLPDGFEERMMKSGKGLIVRSWAPQLLILEHQAIGGFLTHCGWNSAIEGIGAGVPMITWPITAEHFFIESLVTDVLKTGIRVKGWYKNQLLEDYWCSNHYFKVEFPILYRLVLDKEKSLRSLYDRSVASGNWNFQFRRRLYEWEEREVSRLKVLLPFVSGLCDDLEDKLVWLAADSGLFSVSSAYRSEVVSLGLPLNTCSTNKTM